MLKNADRTTVFLLVLLAIVIAGGLLSACGGSGAVSSPESAGMLYFYAEW